MPIRMRIALGLSVAGAALLTVGAALVWGPSGFIVPGLLALGSGVALGMSE